MSETNESQAITRKSASNLALAFILLPKERQEAMAVLYAFCREVDDVADDESVPTEKRRVSLAAWRDDVRKACEGGQPEFVVNRELKPVAEKYRLPFSLFDDLIRGVEMDLEIKRYQTYAELEKYCYRVASVVGLLSIEIFGYQDKACVDYAIYLGKALQLTNILRDVKTDAERGRIYLPLDELKRFQVTEEEILQSKYSERYEKLAAHVAEEARKFYQLARETLPRVDKRSMSAAELMGAVYWGLWKKVRGRRYDVFGPNTVRLTKGHKIALILRTWFRIVTGSKKANYGTP